VEFELLDMGEKFDNEAFQLMGEEVFDSTSFWLENAMGTGLTIHKASKFKLAILPKDGYSTIDKIVFLDSGFDG